MKNKKFTITHLPSKYYRVDLFTRTVEKRMFDAKANGGRRINTRNRKQNNECRKHNKVDKIKKRTHTGYKPPARGRGGE